MTLREIGPGIHAYLQTGSWGFSNAGLISNGGTSLLVDTLYDLRLTRRMLDSMSSVTGSAPIESVVNTHANGDHCWGNQLVDEAKIISSRAAAEEMLQLSPQLMRTLVVASKAIQRMGGWATTPLRLLGRVGVSRAAAIADAAPLIAEAFGPFDFGPISLRPPDSVFEGRLSMRVGDLDVELIEVGPAHTEGDVIVYVPSERLVFTGDILFIDSHPVVWAGPIARWISACDTILELDVETVVPGHGPLTDKGGVETTKRYWQRIEEIVRQGTREGVSTDELAYELLREHGWSEWERLAVNVDTALRDLKGDRSHRDPLGLLAQMARLRFRVPPA